MGDEPDNKKSADFIITPPLFVLNRQTRTCYALCTLARRWRKTENSFLHQRTGSPFNNEAGRRHTLKIATQSVIKLFWRPKGLGIP